MYTHKYGLNQRPFENTPDPQFLFLSNLHREVLYSLVYGIESAKGFILVSGDVGTGKTTLIYSLLQRIDSNHIVLHIINPHTNFDEIVFSLAWKMGVDPVNQNKLKLMDSIREKLISLDGEEKRIIIIIDEAHLLSEKSLEDIRLLSNIETEKRKLIQIVLVGQNELYDLLNQKNQRPLKQRIVINRKLAPFNKKDSIEYIAHRLKIADCQLNLFTSQALGKIWQHSLGIPRIINHICDNALLIGLALDAERIGPEIIDEVIEDMQFGNDGCDDKRKFDIPVHYKWFAVITTLAVITWVVIIQIQTQTQTQTQTSVFQNPDDAQRNIHAAKASIAVLPKNQAGEKDIVEKKSDTNFSGLNKNVKEDGDAHEKNKIIVSEKRTKLLLKPITMPVNEALYLQAKTSSRQTKIQPKEYLSSIANREYGISNETIIDMIHMANPEIKDVNKIFSGQKIVLPAIEKRDLIVKNNSRFHIHYASFYNLARARKALDKLSEKNIISFYIPVNQGEKIVYRIYVGVFDKVDDAMVYLENIDLEYFAF